MAKVQDYQLAIPASLNLFLATGHVFINLYQFLILPIYLLPISSWWGLTLLPLAMLNNPFWSVIHEAIHDLFHPSRRLNGVAGRLLSIFFGSPFRLLRVTHLMHHKFNRAPIEGTELYDAKRRSWARASLGYYGQIFGGLYLLELVSPLPFFLPLRALKLLERRGVEEGSLGAILIRSMLNGEAVREMRVDGVAVLALFGVSAFCYGEHWPMLVAALAARAFLISFLDNVYHYRTPVNDLFYAGNLWLPRSLSKILLHFNLHGIHHKNTAIPWIRLPQAFEREAKRFDDDYFVAATRQLWGPVPLSALPYSLPAISPHN